MSMSNPALDAGSGGVARKSQDSYHGGHREAQGIRLCDPVTSVGNDSLCGLSFCKGIVLLAPATNAPVHGYHVLVSHLLKVVGSEGGTEAAAAVKNHFRVEVGDFLFDVAFDDALAH